MKEEQFSDSQPAKNIPEDFLITCHESWSNRLIEGLEITGILLLIKVPNNVKVKSRYYTDNV